VAEELSLKGTPNLVSSIVRHANDVLSSAVRVPWIQESTTSSIRSQSSDGLGTTERTWSARA
jgi:hypothetical protein